MKVTLEKNIKIKSRQASMFQNAFIDIVFLVCLIITWIVLLYHSSLVIMAYRFFMSGRQRLEENLSNFKDPPFVSIMIPASNEENVIESTMDSMIELDYPSDRYEVLIINDESTDNTKQLLDSYAKSFKIIKPIHVPKGKGRKGKSFALNQAMAVAKGDYICIYDADNNPEPTTLKYLMAEMLSDPKNAVVCGKVRTQNRKKNLLTKFINLEFISHQWMVQAGRWYKDKVAMIPGTNFVFKREILEKLGGWDESALTEDTELTLRILDMGYYVAFNPFAITWEQEPESWKVWQKQRMRWLKGNQYIVKKYLSREHFSFKNIKQIFYMASVYGILLFTIVVSDIVFVLGVINIAHVSVSGPLFLTWFMALTLFVVSIAVTMSFEETSENTLKNIGLAILMYFTYSQAWIFLNIKSFFEKTEQKGKQPFWDKTPRVKLRML